MRGKLIHGLPLLFIATLGPLTMGMGEKFSKQGHALGLRVYDSLIQQRYCSSISDCQKKETVFGEHGNRVNLHLYGITDRVVVSAVLAVVIAEGPDITSGVPITIRVFPKKKKEYLGLKSLVGEPAIKLDIN